MIETAFKSLGKYIVSVDAKGHSGFAEEGQDVVCAAVSSAMMLTHALLYDVKHIPVKTVVENDKAHIYIALPESHLSVGQDALCALKLHFTELEENYPDFIKVYREEVL